MIAAELPIASTGFGQIDSQEGPIPRWLGHLPSLSLLQVLQERSPLCLDLWDEVSSYYEAFTTQRWPPTYIIGMASNLQAMASTLLAMASNLQALSTNRYVTRYIMSTSCAIRRPSYQLTVGEGSSISSQQCGKHHLPKRGCKIRHVFKGRSNLELLPCSYRSPPSRNPRPPQGPGKAASSGKSLALAELTAGHVKIKVI